MTTIVALTAASITAVVAILYGRHITALARTAPAQIRKPRSPLDEAERILAKRYMRGDIGLDEYRRMLSLIRH